MRGLVVCGQYSRLGKVRVAADWKNRPGRLSVFEEPKKAGVSAAGERAAGSEVERYRPHLPWSLPQVHQEAMERF